MINNPIEVNINPEMTITLEKGDGSSAILKAFLAGIRVAQTLNSISKIKIHIKLQDKESLPDDPCIDCNRYNKNTPACYGYCLAYDSYKKDMKKAGVME